ncbi:MAG: ligase-associated DNA damage response exonuclease [Rubrivivax sp.]|nr:ligase-associated DNA damage response exonuclease [Rubrivivax sp.]
MAEDLVVQRPEGLYCPPGDFYIDPWRPVPRAVITHAHADHARRGHGRYLAHCDALGVLRARLGDIAIDGVGYGETRDHHGVRISLHPAGHVLGSAQVRLEHRGRVWVVSGDYFVSGVEGDVNLTCTPFEPVRCDCFITESTFGLPIYRWAAQQTVHEEILAWWRACAAEGRPALLLGYSFGKAQRLLAGLGPPDGHPGPIFVHPAVRAICEAYAAAGVSLPPYRERPAAPAARGPRARRTAAAADPPATEGDLARAIVIAPPGVADSAWAAGLGEASTAFASGWMRLRGTRRRQGLDRGFVLSDHADWPGLMRAIAATGAQRVIVTHGYEDVMLRWLEEQGLQAGRFHTAFGDDRLEDPAAGAELPASAESGPTAQVQTSAPADRLAAGATAEQAPPSPAASPAPGGEPP